MSVILSLIYLCLLPHGGKMTAAIPDIEFIVQAGGSRKVDPTYILSFRSNDLCPPLAGR